jgi:hypothetical protein
LPIPAFERPSAINASTSRSLDVSDASGSSARRAPTSSWTTAGSIADPPRTTRLTMPANSVTSVTRLLSR